MKKRAKVIMLPTQKAEWPNCIWLGRISKQLNLDTSYNENPISIKPIDDSMLPQHLYIVSDDKIEEEDWFYHSIAGIYKCTKISGEMNISSNKGFHSIDACKKIIATTDVLLKEIIPRHNDFDSEYDLPQIPTSFIEHYIKEYNKGNIIDEVLVEYIDNGYMVDMEGRGGSDACWYEKLELKINPDNTINIDLLKK